MDKSAKVTGKIKTSAGIEGRGLLHRMRDTIKTRMSEHGIPGNVQRVQIEGDGAQFVMSDGGSPTIVCDASDASALYVLMPMRV